MNFNIKKEDVATFSEYSTLFNTDKVDLKHFRAIIGKNGLNTFDVDFGTANELSNFLDKTAVYNAVLNVVLDKVSKKKEEISKNEKLEAERKNIDEEIEIKKKELSRLEAKRNSLGVEKTGVSLTWKNGKFEKKELSQEEIDAILGAETNDYLRKLDEILPLFGNGNKNRKGWYI